MREVSRFGLFFSAISLLFTINAVALPKNEQIVSGTADFKHISSSQMEIRPSDQAIINYSQFDIGAQEKVKFIQHSSSSCVLNRVSGENPSKIFGSLESNGKVFLVNPNGLYFGPSSYVNVGSFIASTLDISDIDFLQENYKFALGNQNGVIRNEGVLESVEGSIALLSAKIQNLGLITAKAGTVTLASGQHVTLDFTGDGLIQFSVEGNLKEALIEHLGDISASTVSLKMPVAKKAISEIVNLDGAEEGDLFIEENGIIQFASISSIEARKVLIEAANLEVKGKIDASSSLEKGGEVKLFGREISLEGSLINASGKLGGGKVLIGGEYQGKGKTPYASKVTMDQSSKILCNSYEKGDGGLVVLWSYDRTIFNGQIESQGGILDGNGGLVETSGQKGLTILTGAVRTDALQGTLGSWLLDPQYVYINNRPGHPDEPSCPPVCSSGTCTYGSFSGDHDCRIDLSTISNSTSNVVVQAVESISMYYDESSSSDVGINMTTAGASLTFQLSNPNSLGLSIEAPTGFVFYINTNGGNITLPSFTQIWSDISFSSNGGNIDIPSITKYGGQTDTTLWDLNINAGGGQVSLNSAGWSSNKNMASITISNASVVKTRNPAATASYSISVSGPLNMGSIPLDALGDNVLINSSASISMGNIGIDSSASSNVAISLSGNSGPITIGDVGVSRRAPHSFLISSASSLNMSSVATTGGNISITPPALLNGNTAITSQGGSITYLGGISPSSGNPTLTLNGGSGAVSISGNLNNFGQTNITGSTLSLGTIAGFGGLTLSNSSTASVGGNISVTGNFIQTGSGTFSFAGSSISAADISIEGLSAFSGTMTASGGISLTKPVTVNGTFTANGGPVAFGSTLTLSSNTSITGSGGIAIEGDINGPFNLTLNAPSSAISLGSIGRSSRLNNFAITSASSLSFSSILTDAGNIDISTPLATTILSGTSNPILSSNSGQIFFGNSLIPSYSGLGLAIYSPNNSLQLPTLGSVEFPFGDMTITGTAITMNTGLTSTGNVIANNSGTLTVGLNGISVEGDFSQTGSGAVSLSGNVIVGDDLYFKGAVTITSSLELAGLGGMDFDGAIVPSVSGVSLTLNSGSSSLTVPDLGSDSFPLNTISLIGGSITLASAIKTSSLSINNSGTLNITTVPIFLSGTFQQTGASSTILEQNITAESVLFTGDLVLKADTITIEATAGDLLFKGISENNSNPQTLNLVATGFMSTSATLSTNILSILSAPTGISIGNYLTLTDSCSITAPTGNISIAGNFAVTGTNGIATLIATAGNIIVEENVEVLGSSGVANLSCNAGTLDIGNQLKATNLTISAGNVTIGNGISLVQTGQITATSTLYVENDISASGNFSIAAQNASFSDLTTGSGAISVDAFVTIKGSAPNIATSGGSITFTQPIIPESTAADLKINAETGNVTLDVLGSVEKPFGDITLIGCTIVVGDYYNTGSFEVENCAQLTLPAKVLSAGGDFIQSGKGPVSLSYNITAGQVLYFRGPVTILESITLTGDKGIDFEGPIYAGVENLILTLNAPSSLVVLHNVGTPANPFEGIYITGASVAFKGVIKSSILDFNGVPVTETSTPSTQELFNSVPKTLFFVPGLFSTWNTFFDDEYFQVSPVNFISND